MDASEALKLLRESAAQITTEQAQETINAAAQANPNKRAFTEYTWDLRTDPHYAYLREWEAQRKEMLHGHPGRPFPTLPDGRIDMQKMKEDGLKARAKLAKMRRSPLFSCCVVGNCPEPLCSG